jgi:glycosyltransferase involved in cell wall biosynthesis
MPTLPTVSALMAAYNYEQYVGRAIESALEQEYPPELLDVVVIDDGSTDATAEVVTELARRHPGRVRLVQQPNAGYVAATNRAIAEATGELLALLDADDVWLPHKTRRQVEMLEAQPDLGMVFSDMRIIDQDEVTVHESLAWHLGELPERMYARVLYENVATQSSILFRAALRDRVSPIPAGIPYADWWVTLRAAQFSRMDYSREPLALYRVHGANLTGSVTGPAAVRECRKTIAFQRWVLRNLPIEQLTPDEMPYVWSGAEEQARKLIQAAGSFFADVADVTSEDREQADGLLLEADRRGAAGDLVAEAGLALRALACDPFRVGARERLIETVARANAAEAVPHPLTGARAFVVLVDAEELLEGDDLLLAYADALGGSERVSLAIDATRLPAETAARELEALVARCGLDARPDIEMLAVVGERDAAQRHRMRSAAQAIYRRRDGAQDDGLPVFTPASLSELRALAEG